MSKTVKALSMGFLMVLATVGCQACQAAYAESKHEVFAAGDHPVTPKKAVKLDHSLDRYKPKNPVLETGATYMDSANTPAVRWFEKMDRFIVSAKISSQENIILNTPLNREVERVKRWSDTASDISKRYKALAFQLKNMEIPQGHPGLKEYSELTAEWYSDAAQVYEDMVTKRPPAKTVEDLDEQLDDVVQRSRALKETAKALKAMDDELRNKYRVHYRKDQDSLQRFIKGN
jgi:hypothetical protein